MWNKNNNDDDDKYNDDNGSDLWADHMKNLSALTNLYIYIYIFISVKIYVIKKWI